MSDVIYKALKNHQKELQISIDYLNKNLENSISNYSNLPENEKLLRSITREQEIKEAPYLLLLQKREEAAINLAATKPSIKVIDKATSRVVRFLRFLRIYLIAIFTGFFPTIIISIWFLFDNKIHTKSQLNSLFKNAKVLAEIPQLTGKVSLVSGSKDRSIIAESFRMLIMNLKFLGLKQSKTK